MTSYTPTSRTDRFLHQVLGLKKQEYMPVAWSFTYFFCVLSSYYILRPVREAMAVGSGPDTIPYLFVATFIAMLVVTPVFGWVASRFPRRQFLPWVYLFFVSNILIFWLVFSLAVDGGEDTIWLGRLFYVWLSIFNLFVVAVFWSFMADIYDREQGRRLFGVISAGGSIGALIGGMATSYLVVPIGFQNLLPIAAFMLLVAVFCIYRLRIWVAHEHEHEDVETAAGEKPLGGSAFSGITHTFTSRYFSAMVVWSLISNLLGAVLYMYAAELVEQAIPDVNDQTRFFSNINIASNTLSLIGQMFIVKHVVQRFGIGVSLSLLPIVTVVGFAVMAFYPVLGVVAVLTIVRRGLGYGLTRPTSDMLYSVVTPEEKYKTKNFIDTAVWRAGDLIGTWSVRGLAISGLGLAGISVVMLPFAAVWGVIAVWLGREYRRRARELRDSGVT